jgi:hypothetical protein
MNGLINGLPWNLSALGALVVLTAGIITELDPWIAMERAGIAFIGFWLVGLLGRQAFGSSASHQDRSVKSTHSSAHDQNHSG